MSIDEKRVYGERRERSVAYVGTGQGLAAVELSGDQIGRFGLAYRASVADVATADDRVYVATGDAVLAGEEVGEFTDLGFGGAVALSVADALLAADERGYVSRYRDGEWTTVGSAEAVRAIDGDLVAASDGVYRVDDDGLDPVGLGDARDIAAGGLPLAATDDGLYRLGNGWQSERDGAFTVVAADGRTAHAATADDLYVYGPVDGSRNGDGERNWRTASLPVEEPVADVAYGECPYVVTTEGDFLVDADPETAPDGAGGWRARSLGLADVTALAVR